MTLPQDVFGDVLFIIKNHLFLLRMYECPPIKSHIAEFNSIINVLYEIEVKTEDEDKVHLLLCLLPSYKSLVKP